MTDHGQVVLVDGEAELDHAVDARAKGVGLVQGEAAGQQRSLKQQQHQVLHRLVALVHVSALLQLLQYTYVHLMLGKILFVIFKLNVNPTPTVKRMCKKHARIADARHLPRGRSDSKDLPSIATEMSVHRYACSMLQIPKF